MWYARLYASNFLIFHLLFMTTIHLAISFEHIEEKIRALPDERDKKLYSWETFGIPLDVLLQGIEEMKAEGMKYVPHEECTNRRADGSCGCSDVKSEEVEKKL